MPREDPNVLKNKIAELQNVPDKHHRIAFLLDKEANIFDDEANREYYTKESPYLYNKLAYSIYNRRSFNQKDLLDIRKDHKKKGLVFDDNKYFLECKNNADRAIMIYEYMIKNVFNKEGYEHDKISACISLAYTYYQETVSMHLNTKYMDRMYGGYNTRAEYKKKFFDICDYVINNRYSKPDQICKSYYRKGALSRELSVNGKISEFVSISEKFTAYYYSLPKSVINNDKNASIRYYYLKHCYDKICAYCDAFDGLYWSHVLHKDGILTDRLRPFGGYDTRIEEYRIRDNEFLNLLRESLREYIHIASDRRYDVDLCDVQQVNNLRSICDEISTFGKETINRKRIESFANVLYRLGEFYTIYYISGVERGDTNIGSVDTLRAAYIFYNQAIKYSDKSLSKNLTYLYEHLAKIRILNGEHEDAIKTLKPHIGGSYEVYTALYCYVVTMNHKEFDRLFNYRVTFGSANYIVRELCQVFFAYLQARQDVDRNSNSYRALANRMQQIENSENKKKEKQNNRYQGYN